tara:strand:+ start:396 stop:542 length:147 start_codon:yes stop_codon:yes gene_type:complete
MLKGMGRCRQQSHAFAELSHLTLQALIPQLMLIRELGDIEGLLKHPPA